MSIDECSADVIVVGGGVSGVCAAIAASRSGSSVILIERQSFLGGNATGGLVGPFSTTYFADTKVISGLVDEIIFRLAKYNATLGTQKCPYPPGTTFGTGGWITTFDSEILKCVFDEMISEAGIKVFFHSQLSEVSVSDNFHLRKIWVNSKDGRHCFVGKIFIDATGDGDLAASSGAAFEIGSSSGNVQPATLIVDISNINLSKIKEYIISHPHDFAWFTFPEYHDDPNRVCLAGSGFLSLILRAKRNRELIIGRNRITFFSGVQKDRLKLNATRLNGIDINNIDCLSLAEINARVQALSLIFFVRKYIPGCEDAEIAAMGDYLGIRESRRIIGEYSLNYDDVISGKRFPDSIGCGAYPIDQHKSTVLEPEEMMDDRWIELTDAYDIPYRCLVPTRIEQLLVSGRPISTTHDAMASTRLMVHCMVTGQAAGVAAGISVRTGISPRYIDIDLLQDELIEQKAYIRKTRERLDTSNAE